MSIRFREFIEAIFSRHIFGIAREDDNGSTAVVLEDYASQYNIDEFDEVESRVVYASMENDGLIRASSLFNCLCSSRFFDIEIEREVFVDKNKYGEMFFDRYRYVFNEDSFTESDLHENFVTINPEHTDLIGAMDKIFEKEVYDVLGLKRVIKNELHELDGIEGFWIYKHSMLLV